MPELPEVETVRRGLAERVTGERITSVWFSNKPQTFKSPPQEIAQVLQGARIAGVERAGKHIVIELEADARKTTASRGRRLNVEAHPQCIVHLGMTGALQVASPDVAILKHTHAILRLASGKEIRFVDPRRFGRIWVTRNFQTAGLEPLDTGFDDFARLFRGRKTPIKSALLNQKLLRGVGNIYADESLFRAGIRPRRRASSLTGQELQRLHKAIRRVLREAISAGGSSISDYFDVEGEPGLFQTRHRVYGREGQPCFICSTTIKRVVVAGRGTHYCPKCQR
jgi:formamidopyrimidine-DNA glycosylase